MSFLYNSFLNSRFFTRIVPSRIVRLFAQFSAFNPHFTVFAKVEKFFWRNSMAKLFPFVCPYTCMRLQQTLESKLLQKCVQVLDLYKKCVINPFIPLHVSIWAARGLSLFKKLCNIIWRRDVTFSLSLTVVFARHSRSSQLSLIWSPLESLNRLRDGPSLVYLQSVQGDQFCHSIWLFMTEHRSSLMPSYKKILYH